MARARATSFPDPFWGWGTFALRTAEMLSAAALVIPHRASRRNTPAQLLEMGGEKYLASMQAWLAMSRHWTRMAAGSRAPSPGQWAALWTSGLMPFHRRALSNSRRALRSR